MIRRVIGRVWFAIRFVLGRAQDRPGLTNALLVVFVIVHAVLSMTGSLPNAWATLAASSDAEAIYLALSGPASIVSGFAGVVVVFGLTLSTPRFRQFRIKAGRRLRATWTSTSVCGFLAVALSLAAASVSPTPPSSGDATPLGWAAPWLYELGIVILGHGVLRLIWILRSLIALIQADDTEQVQASARKPLDELPFNRKRAS